MKSSDRSSSHRVFIAVPLQESSEPAYRSILQKFRKYFESARVIPFENAHLTLRFLPSVDDVGVEKLKNTLDGLSGISAPFSIAWQKIGMFKFSNSVWVGPVHSEPLLNSMHRNICHAIHKAGFGLPDKSFRPHLTFARFPDRSECARSEVQKICGIGFVEDAVTFSVDRIRLYKSELGGSVPVYSVLHEIRLDGGYPAA